LNEAQVLAVYDAEYARTYDAHFILDDHYRQKTRFELETLRRLLANSGPWLDVACGTGYFLGQFPGLARAGLDLSPAMLEVARRANPDALFLREGTFGGEFPEWDGRWELVTCMWYSYGYAGSMSALRALIRNLARWTSDTGACFVPICDPENLGQGIRVPYLHRNAGFPPQTLRITGVTWTWGEGSAKRHPDMVAPPVDAMVALFAEHFDVVELVPYPRFHWWSRGRRKALLARGRRRRALAPSRSGAS
jgi:SAM-dependent methyltransferase